MRNHMNFSNRSRRNSFHFILWSWTSFLHCHLSVALIIKMNCLIQLWRLSINLSRLLNFLLIKKYISLQIEQFVIDNLFIRTENYLILLSSIVTQSFLANSGKLCSKRREQRFLSLSYIIQKRTISLNIQTKPSKLHCATISPSNNMIEQMLLI